MITKEIKQNLLKELEKFGNVGSSCLKVGINRATYYRWRKDSKKFSKDSNGAIRIGRENISDIAEYALLQNVKAKKMDAIKYALSHNSPRYKPKPRKVTIDHTNSSKELQSRFSAEEMRKINETSEDFRKLTEELIKDKNDE